MSSELTVERPSHPDLLSRISRHALRLRSFFFSGPASLSDEQQTAVKRSQLDDLVRRTAYWLGILTISAVAVGIFGEKKSVLAFMTWALCLAASFVPYIFLLEKIMSLPKDTAPETIRFWIVVWSIWLTTVALVWMAGNWTLAMLPPATSFFLDRLTFVYLTFLGQLFTVLCFSSNRSILLTVIAVGFFLPFEFVIMDQLIDAEHPRLNPQNAHVYFHGQIAMYLIVGWFVSGGQKRLYDRAVLLEAESNRADAERKRANHFVVTISHDLKQPLTVMTVLLETLKFKLRSAPDVVVIVEKVQQQNRALDEMVLACFDLSRLVAGTWEVNVREVGLPQLFERIVTDGLVAAAAEKQIILECHAPPPYLVKTDPEALLRILQNLVTNAIKYTPGVTAGGPGRVAIECKLENNGKTVSISVIDNGQGIPADRKDDIFKAYVQLDNPERDRAKGFGLGLSIVKGLAHLLKHDVRVESAVGKGSTFSVLVPAIARIPPELLPGGASEEARPDLTGLVVALVEDDRESREALIEYLSDLGCYVIAGESAEEVVRELGAMEAPRIPGFVLSDYRLREKTGMEAVAALRQALDASMPAAIFTAETAPEVLKRIADAGTPLLPKPLDIRQLTALLAAHAPRSPEPNGIQSR
jgi:two-component system, sensor histidine kinase